MRKELGRRSGLLFCCIGFMGSIAERRGKGLGELRPLGIIHDDGPAIGERFDRMGNAARHDCYNSGSGDVRHSVDGDLELALHHLIDFFLRMEMLVNGSATRENVMRERQARRVEIASIPTRQALNYRQAADIDKGHSRS